jgi:hypothetical protein
MRLMIIINKINSTIDYGNLNNQNQICKFHAQNLELTMRSRSYTVDTASVRSPDSGYYSGRGLNRTNVEIEQMPK